MPTILDNLEDYTPDALAGVAKELQKKNYRLDGAPLFKEANQEDDEPKEELNFSSELEIDDRF